MIQKEFQGSVIHCRNMLHTLTAVRKMLITTYMAESCSQQWCVFGFKSLRVYFTHSLAPGVEAFVNDLNASLWLRGQPAAIVERGNQHNVHVPIDLHDSVLCGKCGWLCSSDYSLTHLSQTPSHSSASFHVSHHTKVVDQYLSSELPLYFLIVTQLKYHQYYTGTMTA